MPLTFEALGFLDEGVELPHGPARLALSELARRLVQLLLQGLRLALSQLTLVEQVLDTVSEFFQQCRYDIDEDRLT